MSLDEPDATVGHAYISPAERIGRLSKRLDEEIARQRFASAPVRHVSDGQEDGSIIIEWRSSRRRGRIGFSAEINPKDDGWWIALFGYPSDMHGGPMDGCNIPALVALMRRWEMPWWQRAWKWLRTSY